MQNKFNLQLIIQNIIKYVIFYIYLYNNLISYFKQKSIINNTFMYNILQNSVKLCDKMLNFRKSATRNKIKIGAKIFRPYCILLINYVYSERLIIAGILFQAGRNIYFRLGER
jgi:hypothetical protein